MNHLSFIQRSSRCLNSIEEGDVLRSCSTLSIWVGYLTIILTPNGHNVNPVILPHILAPNSYNVNPVILPHILTPSACNVNQVM